jgi:Leucine-rich repeat (LRR) protein
MSTNGDAGDHSLGTPAPHFDPLTQVRALLIQNDPAAVQDGIALLLSVADPSLWARYAAGVELECGLDCVVGSEIDTGVAEDFRADVAFWALRETGQFEGKKQLSLSECRLLSDLRPLQGLTALESLDISGCRGLVSLEGIQYLPNLRALDLTDCGSVDLTPLAHVPGLTSLRLGNRENLTNLSNLSCLTSLESLDLSGCSALKTLEGITELSGLREVRLDRCQGLKTLGGLPLTIQIARTPDEYDDPFTVRHGHLPLWMSETEGGHLRLNGLKALTAPEAALLIATTGTLELNGLETISDEVAAVLARHQGSLHLDGLQTLSDAAAISFSQLREGPARNGKKTMTKEHLLRIAKLIETNDISVVRQGLGHLEALGSRDVYRELTEEDWLYIDVDARGRVIFPLFEREGFPTPGPLREAAAVHLLRGAGRLEGIDVLRVRSTFALEALQGLESLHSLHFAAPVHGEELGLLRELPGLRSLALADGVLEDLASMPSLPRLEALNLRRCRSLKNLDGIQRFIGLEALDLQDCRALADLSALQGHPSLVRLNVRGCPSISDWDSLAGTPLLTRLEVSLFPDWTDVDCLGGLTELEHLGIRFCRNLTDLEAIRRLPNLKKLEIRGCGGVGGAKQIVSLTSAEVDVLTDADAFFEDFRNQGPLYQLWEDNGAVRQVFDLEVSALLARIVDGYGFDEEHQTEPIYLLFEGPYQETKAAYSRVGEILEKLKAKNDIGYPFIFVDADRSITACFGLGEDLFVYESISSPKDDWGDGHSFKKYQELKERLQEYGDCASEYYEAEEFDEDGNGYLPAEKEYINDDWSDAGDFFRAHFPNHSSVRGHDWLHLDPKCDDR